MRLKIHRGGAAAGEGTLVSYFGFSSDPFPQNEPPLGPGGPADARHVAKQLALPVKDNRGVVALLAAPGSDVDTLVGALGSELGTQWRLARVVAGKDDSFDRLLLRCCQALGVAIDPGERTTLSRLFVRHLLSDGQGTRVTLLVVTNADLLPGPALRQLHMLSELGARRLLQVVLVGGPALAKAFDDGDLQPLREAIGVPIVLDAPDGTEVGKFIEERLRSAGSRKLDLFDPAAVARITEYARGDLTVANRLCGQALLVARLEGVRKIALDHVEHAALVALLQPFPEADEGAASVRLDAHPAGADAALLTRLGAGLQPVFVAPQPAAERESAAAPSPALPAPPPQAKPRRTGALAASVAALAAAGAIGAAGWLYYDGIGAVQMRVQERLATQLATILPRPSSERPPSAEPKMAPLAPRETATPPLPAVADERAAAPAAPAIAETATPEPAPVATAAVSAPEPAPAAPAEATLASTATEAAAAEPPALLARFIPVPAKKPTPSARVAAEPAAAASAAPPAVTVPAEPLPVAPPAVDLAAALAPIWIDDAAAPVTSAGDFPPLAPEAPVVATAAPEPAERPVASSAEAATRAIVPASPPPDVEALPAPATPAPAVEAPALLARAEPPVAEAPSEKAPPAPEPIVEDPAKEAAPLPLVVPAEIVPAPTTVVEAEPAKAEPAVDNTLTNLPAATVAASPSAPAGTESRVDTPAAPRVVRITEVAVPPVVEAPPIEVPPVAAAAPTVPTPAAPRNEPAANVAMVAPPPAAPATDDIFLARAEALLKDGDFAAARLFFQRSVARGNPLAALGMGKTYDPVFFAKSGIIGARGDRKVASEWYRKAAAAGILEADDRLRQLELDYGDSTFRPSR